MTSLTLNEAKTIAYTRFKDNFTGTSNTVFFNRKPRFDEEAVTEWVRFSVITIARSQDTIGVAGNRKFRTQASVMAQVYTGANKGSKPGDLLAQEIADLFEAVGVSGLDFQTAQISETGPDGKWIQHLVEIPFEFDEIK